MKYWKDLASLSLWVVAVVAGFTAMNVYANKPAQTASAAIKGWPAQALRAPGRDTLVVFLHPRCSCSKATVAELERTLPRLQGKTDIILNFYYPASEGEAFAQTSLFESAKSLPGVEVRFDRDAQTAALFGARASGETMYFAKNGDLRFHGGLTPARGHLGDNAGIEAVARLADGLTPNVVTSKVFGCQLKEELRNEVALAQ